VKGYGLFPLHCYRLERIAGWQRLRKLGVHQVRIPQVTIQR
jgi:hypothetical protein